jgi:hypothetical protein
MHFCCEVCFSRALAIVRAIASRPFSAKGGLCLRAIHSSFHSPYPV